MTPQTDRLDLAQRRLRKVLKANKVASARTLEQKISDAGPNPMRVNPHVLTTARKALEADGEIAFRETLNARWYYLTSTPRVEVDAKLTLLQPLHTALQDRDFAKRMGQTLEIAVWRAFIARPEISTFGAYLDLPEHPDSSLYSKEEPPASISGRTCQGRLDFILGTRSGKLAGVEVKNVREWLYPNRAEVRDLIKKCVALDVVPVLIGRRIPYVTFKLLNGTGAIIHQTYNQRFPVADTELANRAKDKDLLGYHDIRVGNEPDARLMKFVAEHLPALIENQRPIFDEYKDLLAAFGGGMEYKEFAARVRRRGAGTNEDNDWEDDD